MSDHTLLEISTWSEVAILVFMVWEKYGPSMGFGRMLAPLIRPESRKPVLSFLVENRTFILAIIGLGIVIWLHFRERQQIVLNGMRGTFHVSGQPAALSIGSNPEIAKLQSQLRDKDAEIKDLNSQFAQFMPPMPPPNLSKEAITELLDETGKLLDIIQKTGLPLADEWRTKITAVNPERICLGLDDSAFEQQIGGLAQKAAQANNGIGAILEINRIDQVELTKALGGNVGGFASAQTGLENYRENIESLARDHPTCDVLARSYHVPDAFLYMDRSLEQFGIWLGKSENSLTNYRDNLRLELRRAP